MAGKEGSIPQRMRASAGVLAGVVEAQVFTFAANPAEQAAAAEKSAKAVRALAIAGQAVVALDAAAERAERACDHDRDGDDEGEGGDADEDEPVLTPEELDALRDEVERRYARFDRDPDGALVAGAGAARAGPASGAGTLEGDRPPRAAPA